ncbi:MAG TPA: prepilin-type N-terminal cleavage/methylation domain-containing protein [Thiobacillaceae bacterium]|nr:prepilin-type N-terminal cleavage/methylation domain-containing protein [Thiobacillaceae bacterium]HNU64165.1 prepilin-type N-terminal cleavage/methylation domain-containing protein [Thiobacillaceae bacterium]
MPITLRPIIGRHHQEFRVRGFTLVELLVVTAVLATLAFMAYGSLWDVQARAQEDAAQAQATQVSRALLQFFRDTGYWPGQGPFALSSAGTATTETSPGSGLYTCAPPGGGIIGVVRESLPEPDDAMRDAWFASPANLLQLFETPALCQNHPLAHLNRWDPVAQRGWRGPYLPRAMRHQVSLGDDLDEATGLGSTVVGMRLEDVPGVGAGAPWPGADASWWRCTSPADSNCMLLWRAVRADMPGYVEAKHLFAAHPRPLLHFGLTNGDVPRLVHAGPDGRYGGVNISDPCLPNVLNNDGQDDRVICLGR